MHLLSGKPVPIYTAPALSEEGLVLHNLGSSENYNLKKCSFDGKILLCCAFLCLQRRGALFPLVINLSRFFLAFHNRFLSPSIFSPSLLCMSSLHIIVNVP